MHSKYVFIAESKERKLNFKRIIKGNSHIMTRGWLLTEYKTWTSTSWNENIANIFIFCNTRVCVFNLETLEDYQRSNNSCGNISINKMVIKVKLAY